MATTSRSISRLPTTRRSVHTYFLYLVNHMALLDCEGVLISIPSQLVTDAFFQSSNAAREPDSLCVDLLTFLHDEIPNF